MILSLIYVNNITGKSDIEWQKTYGGQGYDVATKILQTFDKNYAIIGVTSSLENNNDYWLLQLNSNGSINWTKIYGGPSDDSAYDFLQTTDEGFLIIGSSNSSLTGGTDHDFLLIKTNQTGDVDWYKTYGGIEDDFGISLINTSDDEYVITGITYSFNNKSADSNIIILKINSNGELIWKKIIGGKGHDIPKSIIQTKDDGLAICGYTNSYGAGDSDVWLLKVDENGSMLWNHTYGGKQDDGANSLIQTSDGCFAIAGYSQILLFYDFYLLKTDIQGNIEWELNISQGADEKALSLISLNKTEYILAGFTQKWNGYDSLIVKINYTTNNSNLKPIANAGKNIVSKNGKKIEFNGKGYDKDGKIKKYEWDFNGDGIYDWASNNSGNTTHEYKTKGVYNAYLKVTDNNGSTNIDMKYIEIKSINEIISKTNFKNLCIFILSLLLFSLISIYFYFRKNKKIRKKAEKYIKKHLSFLKIDRWIINLFFVFLILTIIKTIFSLFLSTPWIYNDELIYSVLAKYVSAGKLVLIGNVPFSAAHPPAGYSYFLSPAYLFGNNMDLIYHSMLFINSILTSLIIFPVYLIMKRFLKKKTAFLSSLIIAIIPSVILHNFNILSGNAFILVFLISCYLLIKTFSYKKFDNKFLFYSISLGLSVGMLIFIRSMGIAMLISLLAIIIIKFLKTRKKESLKLFIPILTFLPFIIYIFYKTRSITMGYPASKYIDSVLLIFSNTENFLKFLILILNELNYFVLMSYFIFMSFTIFLFINFRKIEDKRKEDLFYFSIYALFSMFFLIVITVIHIYKGDNVIYTRYVYPALPIIFMLGFIGLNLYNKIKNNSKKFFFQINYIFILLGFFSIIFFPLPPYKIVNNLDLEWITFLTNLNFFNYNGFQILKIIISIILLTLLLLIFKNSKIYLNLFKKKKYMNFFNILIISTIILSFFLYIPSLDEALDQNKNTNFKGYNKPARWFMQNDPKASIIVEDTFGAFSGGGMSSDDWDFMRADMYFWLPDADIKIMYRSYIKNMILSDELNADYILTTHDLTDYYPKVADFYMNIPVSPMKNQEKVDWHIYKVK